MPERGGLGEGWRGFRKAPAIGVLESLVLCKRF